MIDRFLSPFVAPVFDRMADKMIAGGFAFAKSTIGACVLGATGCFLAALQVYVPALVFLLLARFMLALSHKTKETSGQSVAVVLCDIGFLAAFVFFFSLGFLQSGNATLFLIFAIAITGMARMAQELLHATRKDFSGHTETVIFLGLCCLFPGAFAGFAALFGLLWLVGSGLQIAAIRS